MSNYNIEELIKSGESDTLEFKTTFPPIKRISAIISSFANAKGGVIIFGYKENFGPVGINPRDVDSIYLSVLKTLKPKPKINVSIQEYNNKNLAIFEVLPSDKIISSNNIEYYRDKTETTLLTSSYIQQNVQKLPTEQAIKVLADKIEEQSKLLRKATSLKTKLLDYFIGFVIGVFASCVAGIILHLFKITN